jgi:Uma2 family endonuclease
MSTAPLPRIDRLAYLARERAAGERSEYRDGRVVAMAGAGRDHNRVVTNLVATLDNALRHGPCNVYANDLRVSVAGGARYLYPDVIVTCGEEVFEDDRRDNLVNPLLLVEVLSPGTEAYDRGEKFLAYQQIPSLREYVLVTIRPRRVEVFRRQDDGGWRYASYPFAAPPVHLESIDVGLTFASIFARVPPEGPVPS